MERQAGLGRSLEEVIESLTPAEPDAALTRGAGDPFDVTPQLYRLVLEVQDLRDRVSRIEAGAANGNGSRSKSKPGKESKKKHNASSGRTAAGKKAGAK